MYTSNINRANISWLREKIARKRDAARIAEALNCPACARFSVQ
jgi:hypothetical protein